MIILLRRSESLVMSSPSPVTLNQSHDCKYLYADSAPVYITHMDLALLSRSELRLHVTICFIFTDGNSILSVAQPKPGYHPWLFSFKLYFHLVRKFSWLNLQNTSKPRSLLSVFTASSTVWMPIISCLDDYISCPRRFPSFSLTLSCIFLTWDPELAFKNLSSHHSKPSRGFLSHRVKTHVLKMGHEARHSLPVLHLLFLAPLSWSLLWPAQPSTLAHFVTATPV